MAFSYYNYTGDGATTQFPVAFPYIRREHVLAAVAGSPATFTFVNSSTIQMDVAPANGAVVRVYRQTPLTAPLVDFTDGATLVAADLDTNAKQSIYTQQELDDSLVEGLADVIPNGDKGDITTSVGGTIWTIDTGAVVEAKIGTGAVSAAKIAAGAFTDSVSSTSTTTIATPNSVKTSYDLATTANTTANAALPKAGGTMTGVITYAAAQPRLVLGTAVAATSGTSIDFTGIPSWVKRVTVMFDQVSLSGSSSAQVQIGSGSVTTTGYSSYGGVAGAVNISGGISSTTGFVAYGNLNTNILNASCVITLLSGTTYSAASVGGLSSVGNFYSFASGGVSPALSGALDRVRITSINGTDTFDAGTINILYEG